MKPEKEIIVGLGVLVLVILAVVFYLNPLSKKEITPSVTPVNIPEPKKTDFGTKAPTDFPTNIPIEQGTKVNQSYTLDYPGQKQLTIVFSSTKTIKQNYDLYSAFLKKDGWTVTNKYESATVSSLYGTKGNNEINITISTSTDTQAKSQVSISVLKK